MALRLVIDRRRCIGAGTCITLGPTALQWRKGDFRKPEVTDLSTVDEDTLREMVIACPTQALVLEEVIEAVTG